MKSSGMAFKPNVPQSISFSSFLTFYKAVASKSLSSRQNTAPILGQRQRLRGVGGFDIDYLEVTESRRGNRDR